MSGDYAPPAAKWNSLPGTPFVTVSPGGLADGYAPNNGANFGPDTPGTTTCGIQEALNSFGSTGGVVRLLPGTYVTSPLTIGASVTIEGSGIATGWSEANDPSAPQVTTILKLADGYAASLLTIGSAAAPFRGWSLRHLVLDGNKANQTGGSVLTTYSGNGFVLDCEVRNGYANGVEVLTQTVFAGLTEDNRFIGCSVHDNTDSGYYFGYGDQQVLEGNSFNNGGDGVHLPSGSGAGGVSLTRLNTYGNGGDGVYIGSTAAAPTSRVRIVGCYIDHNSKHGIEYVGPGADLIVAACTLWYNSTGAAATYQHIQFDGTGGAPVGYSVLGCSFADNAQNAIAFVNGANGEGVVMGGSTNLSMYVPQVGPRIVNVGGYNPQGFGITTPAVPAGTGSANKVANTNPFPVRIYPVGASGGHIIDPSGTDKALGVDPLELTLDPGAAYYVATTAPSAWLWYGV